MKYHLYIIYSPFIYGITPIIGGLYSLEFINHESSIDYRIQGLYKVLCEYYQKIYPDNNISISSNGNFRLNRLIFSKCNPNKEYPVYTLSILDKDGIIDNDRVVKLVIKRMRVKDNNNLITNS